MKFIYIDCYYWTVLVFGAMFFGKNLISLARVCLSDFDLLECFKFLLHIGRFIGLRVFLL